MNDSREDELLKELQAKDSKISHLSAEMERLTRENTILKQNVDALVRKIFGAKSEHLDPNQLLFLLQGKPEEGPAQGKESGPEASEALLPVPDKKASASRPRKERGPRVPDHLPVVEEVIVPVAVRACPEAWRRMGEEVTELLDFTPGRFFKRRIVRPKYIQIGQIDAVPAIADLPPSLQERSIVTPSLMAEIVVNKFVYHLPLYRQEYIFESRYGVWLPRQTMARWMELAADWLKPIYEEIRKGIMKPGYVQIDETAIHYLVPGNKKTKQGYMWVCSRPAGDVFFTWDTGRSTACLEAIVPVDFIGTIQCDGFSVYDCFAKIRGAGITLAGCAAHVRRYFFNALEEAPQMAAWILRQIQQLYAVEKELRESGTGPQGRQAARTWRSRPVLNRLKRLFESLQKKKRYLPQSRMAKAITYALGQWESLCVYLNNGLVEIDNNIVENSIRPTAVGKKNWLFIGDAEAGERSAIIYTIVECCRRRGIDPHAYLRDVLTRLPLMTNWQVKDVTPEAWAKAQTQSKTPVALAA
jgi:transposase